MSELSTPTEKMVGTKDVPRKIHYNLVRSETSLAPKIWPEILPNLTASFIYFTML